MKNTGLVPLINYGEVQRGLYRCAQPIHAYQYEWLKEALGVRLIINLRAENQTTDNKYGEIYEIKTVGFKVPDHQPPTSSQATEFMKLVKGTIDPMLIHCEHGHGRTSTFCVLAKVALGWSFDEAMEDEKRRWHYKFKYPAQELFLTEFIHLHNEQKTDR